MDTTTSSFPSNSSSSTSSFPASFSLSSPLSSTFEYSESNTWYSWLTSWKVIFVLIIFLAFIGINIFTYLSKGTNFIVYLTKMLGKETVEITKSVENIIPSKKKSSSIQGTSSTDTSAYSSIDSSNSITNSSNINTNTNDLYSSLSPTTSSNETSEVVPDDSLSSIQSSAISGKAGWCFIGTDRGIRTCGKVGVNDTCMSGDIFPSQDICINPSLR